MVEERCIGDKERDSVSWTVKRGGNIGIKNGPFRTFAVWTEQKVRKVVLIPFSGGNFRVHVFEDGTPQGFNVRRRCRAAVGKTPEPRSMQVPTPTPG